MKKLLLIFTLSFGPLYSQEILEKKIPGKSFPIALHSLQNSVQLLKSSPKLIKNVKITLPNFSGEKVIYNLTENDLSEKRVENITTFDGISIDGNSKLKLSLFDDHFVAIIKNREGYFYIEPYKTSAGNYRIYPTFSDFGVNFTCDIGTDADLMRELNMVKDNFTEKTSAPNFPYGNKLRKFRIAIAATGEFTSAFNSNQDTALAEVLSMLNIINLIYESELSITFNAIAKTTNKTLIFTNSSADPFSVDPDFANAANSQAAFTAMDTDGTLAYSLYDLGHTFHIIPSGGAQGQAGTQPCTSTSKARAWSQWSLVMPKGIVANLIVHEMGHQFSAGHTYNAVGGGISNPTFCTGGWGTTSAVEPGSGTTIMSYGNNCSHPVNQVNNGNNSLNYFNARSLDQITSKIAGTANCFTTQSTTNKLPYASAGINITIPKNTPFKLNGLAFDGNDTNLSYTWEQADIATANDKGAFGNAITGTGGYVASESPASAPLFRSEQSIYTTERTFPKLKFILNKGNLPPLNEAEILPAVARTMKFRFTVRDNNLISGGADSDEMTVNVHHSGPLKVTYPSLRGISIPAMSLMNVTWDVNGTNAIQSNVDIMLSLDGGNTYPYELAMNTPNDGNQEVIIPNIPGTIEARVKIGVVLNTFAEFFDISDKRFTINSNCKAYQSYITPTTMVNATAGSSESNLNMAPPVPASTPYTEKNVRYTPFNTTLNDVFVYTNSNMTTPTRAYENFASSTYSFRVTKSGNYTLSKSYAGFLIMSVHKGKPFTIGNFVGSNAAKTNFNNIRSNLTTENLPLVEGITYHLVLCKYSDPENNLIFDLSSSGPGLLYEVDTATPGFIYTFLAIAPNKIIKAVSPTAKFSSLPPGNYTVKGISYSNMISSSNFINKTFAELLFLGNCFSASSNERPLILNSVLGTVDNSALREEISIGPNPVDNYLTVKSKQKITDYQILDISGRLIVTNVFKSETLNFSRLKTGTYILLLLDEGKIVHQEKIIKK